MHRFIGLLWIIAALAATSANAATSCDGGFYINPSNPGVCVISSPGASGMVYYSPEGDIKRYECPAGTYISSYCWAYNGIPNNPDGAHCNSITSCWRDVNQSGCYTGFFREDILSAAVPDNCDAGTNTCTYTTQPTVTIKRSVIGTLTAKKGYRLDTSVPLGSIAAGVAPGPWMDACPACAAGTFQDTDGSTKTACDPCPAGTYQPNTGQSSCIACPAGTYQDQAGQTSCKCVGNDYWAAAGSVGRTACTASTKSGGCGAGAASANDCTPYKTLRNSHTSNAPILRTVRTAPAGRNLNVSIDGVIYYGNLTETLVPGAIKLEFNGTVYSVMDNATQ